MRIRNGEDPEALNKQELDNAIQKLKSLLQGKKAYATIKKLLAENPEETLKLLEEKLRKEQLPAKTRQKIIQAIVEATRESSKTKKTILKLYIKRELKIIPRETSKQLNIPIDQIKTTYQTLLKIYQKLQIQEDPLEQILKTKPEKLQETTQILEKLHENLQQIQDTQLLEKIKTSLDNPEKLRKINQNLEIINQEQLEIQRKMQQLLAITPDQQPEITIQEITTFKTIKIPEIHEYLKHVKTKYCTPIYQTTLKTINQYKQIDPEDLKQKQPPINTIIKNIDKKQEYKTLPTKCNKLWESEDLGASVERIIWSHNGDKLVAITSSNKVIVFSSDGSKVGESRDLGDSIKNVVWSPDGNKLVVSTQRVKVILLDINGNILWERDLSDKVRGVPWTSVEIDSITWDSNEIKVTIISNHLFKNIIFDINGDILWEDISWKVRAVKMPPVPGEALIAITPSYLMTTTKGGWKVVIYHEKIIILDNKENKLWMTYIQPHKLEHFSLGPLFYDLPRVYWSPTGDKLAVVTESKIAVFNLIYCNFYINCKDFENCISWAALICTSGVIGEIWRTIFDVLYFDDYAFELAKKLEEYNVIDNIEIGLSLIYDVIEARGANIAERIVNDAVNAWRRVEEGLEDDDKKSLREFLRWVWQRYGDWRFLEELPGLLEEWSSARGDLTGYLAERLEVGLEGEFSVGVYGEGSVRVCNKSAGRVSLSLKGCEGVACRILGDGRVELEPGECDSINVVLKFSDAGSVPVDLEFEASGFGVEAASLKVPVVARVKGGARPIPVRSGVGAAPPRAATLGVLAGIGSGEYRLSGGLAGGYGCDVGEFEFGFPRLLGIEGFSGVWDCCKLGCGGWGCAYKCMRAGRVVVVKTSLDYAQWVESGGSGELSSISLRALQGYVRRAEAIYRLGSPGHVGLVRLLAYSKNIPLLVYEYADQGSLAWQLSHGWEPSDRDVLIIGAVLADALRYIHSRGMIHGDIKPGNVFIAGGIPKLGDFSGIVRLLSATSIRSQIARHSTPGWRAPEQVYRDLRIKAKEHGLENRIDVYQLGNLLLYLLTGVAVDGEEADDSLEEALALVEDDQVREVLRGMTMINPWERMSSEEAAKILAGILAERTGEK